ncbi:MAG: hypothetical protein LUG45_02600 [Clostridiales bacterium]|nr:hypothetical protein [Clostridiales bacterium]
MKKYIFPILALALGAAGAYARAWQLDTAFEADTGLLIPNAPATRLLLGVALVAVCLTLVCALFCLGKRADCRAAVGAASPALRRLMVLPALGYLLAGLTLMREQFPNLPAGASTLLALYLPLLLGVVLLVSGAGLLAILWRPDPRRWKPGTLAMLAMLPGFACCLMLVYVYHENANNPVVAAFAWPELAMVAAVLAWYRLARFAFRPESCALPCWFCLLAMTLQLTVLPDTLGTPFRLVLLSNLLWFGLHLWQVLRAMTPAPASEEPPAEGGGQPSSPPERN